VVIISYHSSGFWEDVVCKISFFISPARRGLPHKCLNKKMKLWQATDSDYRADRCPGSTHAQWNHYSFHGNGGTALDRGFYIKLFTAVGFRVILAEYPKYGARPGKVGEKPFVFDGLETVRLAYEQYGEPLYLVGESLGCGVAAAIAKKTISAHRRNNN